MHPLEQTLNPLDALRRCFPGYSSSALERLAAQLDAETQDAATFERLAATTLPPDLLGCELTAGQLLVMFRGAVRSVLGPEPTLLEQNAPPITTLVPGALVGGGRYYVDKRLNAGAFGETYRIFARATPGRLPFVLKRLHKVDDQAKMAKLEVMLRNEAEILFALGGGSLEANIPDLYEILPDEHSLVMTAVEGKNLADLLEEEPNSFAIAAVLSALEDISAALAYLHMRGIVHHDLKPGNVIRDPAGRIWLADFGIGRPLAQLLGASLSRVGGTPFFAPPEQLEGLSEERSDIYAFGMTAAVLLTHLPPMIGPVGLLAALRGHRPRVPAPLQHLIARCLSPVPASRPSAKAVLAEIRRLRASRGDAAGHWPLINTDRLAAEFDRTSLEQLEVSGRRLSREQRASIVQQLQSAQPASPSPRGRAQLLAGLAELRWQERDFVAAVSLCREGLATLPPAPAAPEERAILLKRLGTAYGDQQMFPEADEALQAALGYARAAGALLIEGRIWHNIALYADERGRLVDAKDAYHQSLLLREKIGDLEGAVESLNNLGVVALTEKQFDTAYGYFQQCRDLSKQARRPDIVGVALTNLGTLHLDRGDRSAARDALTVAERLCAGTAQPTFHAMCLYTLGEIALLEGDPLCAAAYARQALTILGSAHDRAVTARTLRILAKVAQIDGSYEDARRLLQRAWRLRGDEEYDHAFLLEARADLAYRQGRLRSAARNCRQAIALAESSGAHSLATTLRNLAGQIRTAMRGMTR